MNRKILFRGKRVDNGEWVYGYAVKGCDKDNQMFIAQSIGIGFFTGGISAKEVIPKTVGQYTGLTDKNSNKIFEGDIVKIVGDSNNDDWKDVNYVAQIIFLDNGFCAINGTTDNYSLRRYGLSRCEFDLEVIGNIHDNPELLEVEQ